MPLSRREKIRRVVLIAITFTAFCSLSFAAELHQKSYTEDLNSIQSVRNGMKEIIRYVDAHPEIFPADQVEGNSHPLNREQRMAAWQVWQKFLDHLLFYDSMGRMYADLYNAAGSREEKRDPFYAAFACFLAQYRYALEYIDRMERNPAMHVILNEAVPELGLASDLYAQVKFRFLNVVRGAEFARLNVLYLYFRDGQNPLDTVIENDRNTIWQAGKGMGPALTAQNALQVVGDLGFTAWFPVQRGTSELMGNIKVWRPGVSLISSEQVAQLQEQLHPGDILLERREWYATNVGIPGFWTHAALYIGTAEERGRFFNEPGLADWFVEQGSRDGTIDSLLQKRYPDKYKKSMVPDADGHLPRVLEAIAEGVSFTSLEHTAFADSIVVLRPDLSQKDIARAIIRGFNYSGRPYDFNFDFRTDAELVCSELVYKVYEPSSESKGLVLPLTEVLERPLLSPNEIARLFDTEYGTEKQQLRFVAFLDGSEKDTRAYVSDVEAFKTSWQRPKWHILVQDLEEK